LGKENNNIFIKFNKLFGEGGKYREINNKWIRK
jgi:hypothetical protein